MIMFLLIMILAVLILGTGGIAALLLFAGFCAALLFVWVSFGGTAAVIFGIFGFYMFIK